MIKRLFTMFILLSVLLAGCGGEQNAVTTEVSSEMELLTTEPATSQEATTGYGFEIMEDNIMVGDNYGQITPVYYFGEIYDCYSNDVEDGYAVDKKCTEDAYELYKAQCMEEGFTEQRTTTLEDSTFCSLTDGDHVLTIMDVPSLGKMFITMEAAELQADPDQTTDRKSADSSVSLSMIGQDGGKYAMGFVYRLADGRFVIIDGGYEEGSAAQWIYDEMKQQTPEGEDIVIAAWILTHAHNDHCGAFVGFAKKYHGQVTIEKVMYNFGFDEQYSTSGQNYVYHDNVKAVAADYYFKGVETVNPHPGSIYEFGDFKITYIYTAEIMIASPMASFNSTSNVFTVETSGQKYIFLADSNSENTPFMLTMYPGDTLESDVLQVAHHGYNVSAMSSELYEKINPSYVLWPSGSANFDKKDVQNLKTNKWLFDNVSSDCIWVSRESVHRFTLPLAAGSETIIEH